jgi:hypothetical protein
MCQPQMGTLLTGQQDTLLTGYFFYFLFNFLGRSSSLGSLLLVRYYVTYSVDLLLCDEVLGNRLVSSEWISRSGNPGDNLIDVVETITKEGVVLLHL